MNNPSQAAAPGKSAGLPFRPLLAPPVVTHWADEVGAVHVLLSGRRKADGYEIIPISTDMGGAAFRWFKRGGECYDVLCNGRESSCTCPGWAFTSGCKHLHATFALLESGVLRLAPGSAAGHADDAPDAPA